jgi:hypothetical protein
VTFPISHSLNRVGRKARKTFSGTKNDMKQGEIIYSKLHKWKKEG